jgi:putative glutamine amidotransferase
MGMDRPVIGITADATPERHQVARAYTRAVAACGGVPVLLPAEPDCIEDHIRVCHGFVLTGGDDPAMEAWGEPTHPKARPIDPQRQRFEVGLLAALARRRPDCPVLGVCLGMQLMALCDGGALDQHLPDTLPTAASHWGHAEHLVSGPAGEGLVHSHHRQAVRDAGALQVTARSPDGVIEAVRSGERHHYVGVQWHPERTSDARLGLGLFAGLVRAARRG